MIHLSIISYAHAWSKPDFFYHTTVTINIIQSHYYSFFFLSSSSRVECDLTKGIFLGPFPPPSTWHRTMKTSGPGSQTSPPIDMRVCVHILRMMSFYFKVAMHLNSDTSSDMNVSFEPQTSNSHDYIYQMSPHPSSYTAFKVFSNYYFHYWLNWLSNSIASSPRSDKAHRTQLLDLRAPSYRMSKYKRAHDETKCVLLPCTNLAEIRLRRLIKSYTVQGLARLIERSFDDTLSFWRFTMMTICMDKVPTIMVHGDPRHAYLGASHYVRLAR